MKVKNTPSLFPSRYLQKKGNSRFMNPTFALKVKLNGLQIALIKHLANHFACILQEPHRHVDTQTHACT